MLEFIFHRIFTVVLALTKIAFFVHQLIMNNCKPFDIFVSCLFHDAQCKGLQNVTTDFGPTEVNNPPKSIVAISML